MFLWQQIIHSEIDVYKNMFYSLQLLLLIVLFLRVKGQQQTFLNKTIFLNKILIFKQMGSEEKTLAQDGEQDIISIYAHLLDNHSPHH